MIVNKSLYYQAVNSSDIEQSNINNIDNIDNTIKFKNKKYKMLLIISCFIILLILILSFLLYIIFDLIYIETKIIGYNIDKKTINFGPKTWNVYKGDVIYKGYIKNHEFNCIEEYNLPDDIKNEREAFDKIQSIYKLESIKYVYYNSFFNSCSNRSELIFSIISMTIFCIMCIFPFLCILYEIIKTNKINELYKFGRLSLI